MHNYIFDLDGTLVDSSKEIIRCLVKAFEFVGYEIDKKKFSSDIIGPPINEIILNIAPELEGTIMPEQIIKSFRQIYDYDKNDLSTMYEGIFEYLCELKLQGKKLFLATYKPSAPTLRLVSAFGLNMFEDIYTVDKFNKKISKKEMLNDIILRYNLEKSETVMIGDSMGDVLAAKEVGIAAVGVLWGYGSDKSKLIQESDYVVSSVKELRCQKLSYQTI